MQGHKYTGSNLPGTQVPLMFIKFRMQSHMRIPLSILQVWFAPHGSFWHIFNARTNWLIVIGNIYNMSGRVVLADTSSSYKLTGEKSLEIDEVYAEKIKGKVFVNQQNSVS